MLTEEIVKAQRLVRTDAYQMSIGEIVSMYDSREIIIDPEFQRLLRWDISQKSRLIESLLLGIPLPSIFDFEQQRQLGTHRRSAAGFDDSGVHGEASQPTARNSSKYLTRESSISGSRSRWISPANSCPATSTTFGNFSAEGAPTPDSRICWIEGACSISGTISRRKPRKEP
jgi:hypothetical protein